MKKPITSVNYGFKKTLSGIGSLFSSRVFLNIVIIFLLCGFAVCMLSINSWRSENETSNGVIKNITDKYDKDENLFPDKDPGKEDYYKELKFMTIDINPLKNENPDTVAWIKIPAVNVSFPVVQADDNDYYLNYNFKKEKSEAGWIYANNNCGFTPIGYNTMIFGHARKDRSMFGPILSLMNKSYYKDYKNHYVWLNTSDTKMIFQIYSIYYMERKEVDTLISYFVNKDSFARYIDKTMQLNLVPDVNYKATADDKILTLMTCRNTHQSYIIHARLVRSEPL